MKKIYAALVILLPLLLSGCGLFAAQVETSSSFDPAEYSYVYTPESDSTQAVPASEEPASVTEEPSISSVPATEPASVVTVPNVELPSPPDTTKAPAEPSTGGTAQTETTTAVITRPSDGEIDLSIQMPEANGVMEVSKDPENVFIAAVHEARGIDTALLAAVYAVPESGQNYVFEFRNASERTAESLRRVYLLQTDGKIVSVAASDSAEKENLSATENWFCMNVLIKNMVFPAVKDRM